MNHRMRIFTALTVMALAFVSMPTIVRADVSAQGGQIGPPTSPIQMLTVAADTNSAGNFGPGNYIIGMKVVATTGTGQCTLYDAATVAAGTNSTVIDEISEATTGETNVQMWPSPYKITTDVSIDVTTAICIVYFY